MERCVWFVVKRPVPSLAAIRRWLDARGFVLESKNDLWADYRGALADGAKPFYVPVLLFESAAGWHRSVSAMIEEISDASGVESEQIYDEIMKHEAPLPEG